MGAHMHKQWGHLPSPGKVEKFYRIKNCISEVSLNCRAATFPLKEDRK